MEFLSIFSLCLFAWILCDYWLFFSLIKMELGFDIVNEKKMAMQQKKWEKIDFFVRQRWKKIMEFRLKMIKIYRMDGRNTIFDLFVGFLASKASQRVGFSTQELHTKKPIRLVWIASYSRSNIPSQTAHRISINFTKSTHTIFVCICKKSLWNANK